MEDKLSGKDANGAGENKAADHIVHVLRKLGGEEADEVRGKFSFNFRCL